VGLFGIPGILLDWNTRPSGAVGAKPQQASAMNKIIYIIGAVVVVIAILSFLGLR
jgi:hypothetical protein